MFPEIKPMTCVTLQTEQTGVHVCLCFNMYIFSVYCCYISCIYCIISMLCKVGKCEKSKSWTLSGNYVEPLMHYMYGFLELNLIFHSKNLQKDLQFLVRTIKI